MPLIRRITAEDIRQAAIDKPHKVNPTSPSGNCFYFYDKPFNPELDGRPGCIVGHVLNSLGMTLGEMQRLGVTEDVADDLPAAFFASELDQRFAYKVQRHADAGRPWHIAVEYAEEEM